MNLIVLKNGNQDVNKIALTFDDGPNPFWTIKILDVLDRYNIKGNFFVLGKWAEKYPGIVKETFNRGNLIGNHTYSHPKGGDGDFEKCEEVVFKILGVHTGFIRAPYFHTDLCNNYTPAVNREKKIIDSDVIPVDWDSHSERIKNITNEQTQNGSIILLHDGSESQEEIENRPAEMFKVLPEIIENLRKKFQFVRLDELDFKVK
jgi:peptidoglycan/xylan/chitin deacetylase (PgdA/CDA1 family)